MVGGGAKCTAAGLAEFTNPDGDNGDSMAGDAEGNAGKATKVALAAADGRVDALTKMLNDVTGRIEPLLKTFGAMAATIERLSRTPVPPLAAKTELPAGLHRVEKAAASEAAAAAGTAEEETNEAFLLRFAQMSEEDQQLLLIKASRTPGFAFDPITRQRLLKRAP
jgi:hypothetical protein